MKILDGFKNIIKGLGTSRDPRENTYYQQGQIIDQNTANNLYVYNWIAAKVANIPVDDATRKWRNLLISDADEKKAIEDIMTQFQVKEKVNQASKWARVFGGAVIIAVVDGNQEMPLDVESIREGDLKNLLVLDRYNIYPVGIDYNITSENFGNPEFYTVVRSGQNIHHSRVIKFLGEITTIMEYERQNYWGSSIFTRQLEPIKDSQVTSQSIADLIYESNVDVYRINGLNQLVAEGNDDVVVNRLKLAHDMKSIIYGIALDKEDEYEKKTNSFTSLSEIDDRFIQKIAGASDIPVTRLLGISPAGMNATGESDMLNYYDNVSSIQENYLRPKLDWIDKIVSASAGYQDQFKYEFMPLKQLAETEQATVEFQRAQRDQIYLDYDIINTIDAKAQLAENGTYVTIDENRVETEKTEFDLGVDGDE